MHDRKKTASLTADHLEEQANARANEAKQLPEGEAKQHALRNAAQLVRLHEARAHTQAAKLR
jgi:hypothetical protein